MFLVVILKEVQSHLFDFGLFVFRKEGISMVMPRREDVRRSIPFLAKQSAELKVKECLRKEGIVSEPVCDMYYMLSCNMVDCYEQPDKAKIRNVAYQLKKFLYETSKDDEFKRKLKELIKASKRDSIAKSNLQQISIVWLAWVAENYSNTTYAKRIKKFFLNKQIQELSSFYGSSSWNEYEEDKAWPYYLISELKPLLNDIDAFYLSMLSLYVITETEWHMPIDEAIKILKFNK